MEVVLLFVLMFGGFEEGRHHHRHPVYNCRACEIPVPKVPAR